MAPPPPTRRHTAHHHAVARPRAHATTTSSLAATGGRSPTRSAPPADACAPRSPAIIFLISSFLGSKPSARIATFSSLASIVPARSAAVDRRVSVPRGWGAPSGMMQGVASARAADRSSLRGAAGRPLSPGPSPPQRTTKGAQRGCVRTRGGGGRRPASSCASRGARARVLCDGAPPSPEPSVSKRSKASRISCFCSSVSSGLPPFLAGRPDAGLPGAMICRRHAHTSCTHALSSAQETAAMGLPLPTPPGRSDADGPSRQGRGPTAIRHARGAPPATLRAHRRRARPSSRAPHRLSVRSAGCRSPSSFPTPAQNWPKFFFGVYNCR